jgi:hypothetical protein
MLVQRVLPPTARRESWTVLGDDGPVQPIERYLAYLTDIERSPNTVKAYAHDLKDWFVFLAGQGWTGGRFGWKTLPGSSPGCGGPRPRAMGR